MDNQNDLISGLEYYDGEPVPTGFVDETQKSPITVALENHAGEIQKYGMSKDAYAAVEAIAPGTFGNINPRKLTIHRSRTGQQVAVEDISKALMIAGGVAAGGLGLFGLWKLIKFLMNKFKKDGDGDDKDDTTDLKSTATENKEAADAKLDATVRSVEGEIKEATEANKPVDEAVVALATRGIEDKDYVHKLSELAKKHYHSNPVYIPFFNSMAHSWINDKETASVFARCAELIVKHPLTKRFPQYMFGLATMSHPLPALAVCVLGGKIPEMPTVVESDIKVLEDYIDIIGPELKRISQLDPDNNSVAAEVAAQAGAFKRKMDALTERAPFIKSLLEAKTGNDNVMVGIHFHTKARGGFNKVILPPENGPIAEALASFFEAGGMPVNSAKLNTEVNELFRSFPALEKEISGIADGALKEIDDGFMKGSTRAAYTNYINYLKKQVKILATAMGTCRKQQMAIRYGVKWCTTASKTRLPGKKVGTESYADLYSNELPAFRTAISADQEL